MQPASSKGGGASGGPETMLPDLAEMLRLVLPFLGTRLLS